MARPRFKSVVVLTGAGISAESGLGTFRDKNGLWTQYDLAEVATPQGFARNPALVHEFYNARRANLRSAAPNDAHRALARLQRDFAGRVLIVTQNVDDLHERAAAEIGHDAASQGLIHMHGELFRIRCEGCGEGFAWREDLSTATPCPACGQGGGLRPAVVWFGEMPLAMERIEAAVETCDLFLAIGTSGNVYPAAGFVMAARQFARAHTVELNLERSEGASLFAEAHQGPATRLVPDYVKALLKT